METQMLNIGFHKVLEPIRNTKPTRDTKPTKRNRKGADQHQRDGHAGNTFGGMGGHLSPWRAKEREANLAHGIEGGQEGRNRQRPEDPKVTGIPGTG